jgi:hypothetical protein
MVKSDIKANFSRASPVYTKEVCNKLYTLSKHKTELLIIVCFRLTQTQTAPPSTACELSVCLLLCVGFKVS